MPPNPQNELIDARGRKYLTGEERARFLGAVRAHRQPAVQTLAQVLAMTGSRVSEALALRARDVDLEASEIRIATLKRRRKAWRAVPVLEDLAHELALVHGLRRAQASPRGRNAGLNPTKVRIVPLSGLVLNTPFHACSCLSTRIRSGGKVRPGMICCALSPRSGSRRPRLRRSSGA